jgi:transcription-repair coupling factor (superfamily II helicase)
MYSIIKEKIKAQKNFLEFAENLVQGKSSFSLFGVNDSIKPFFLACLNEKFNIPIIFICKNSKEAKAYFEQGYLEGSSYFPPKDMEFQRFDAKSRDDENLRVGTLKRLVKDKLSVVFTSFDALLPKLCPEQVFSKSILTIKKGQTYNIADLFKRCIKLGYMPESLVEGEGAIAKRGSILDIYVPSEHAYRIDFFGDEVESIKSFDPLTQRTKASIYDEITVSCATEFVFDENYLDSAIATLEKEISKNPNNALFEDLDHIKEGKTFEGIEKYLYAFYKGSSVFDYAKDCIVVFDSEDLAKKEAEVFLSEFKHDLLDFLHSKEATKNQINNLFEIEEILSHSERFKRAEFSAVKKSPDFKGAREIVFSIKSPNSYLGKLDIFANDIKVRIAQGYSVYIYTGDERNSKILLKVLSAKNIDLPISQKTVDSKGAIIPYSLESGAEFSESRCIFFGEKDLYGFRKRREKTQSSESLLDIFTDLDVGDIVVHELHGRGKYLGLSTIAVQGKKRDYILLEYKGGDKLYIPTEQIDRVQKYIGGEAPKLSKLGSKEWDLSKAKVSKSVKQLAFDLVKIYSERTVNKGYVFSPDSGWQEDFETSFPFQETDGQVKCISEIKSDMESKKVMDRLLLGDVGFGKTEVAMRACFKAVYDQKQVAILVPTTLLARQHYENFKDRFSGFPVKIAQLSRFVPEAKKKKTLRSLEEGNLDILIGTHALLSERVKFSDLGLLIVDEEQHFGVGHKEKIKNLKRDVDVLTLSATPIPRTLEMSLIGIRDLSMLKTPPIQRKKIKTYVMEYSKQLLSRSITREIQRGGQCYFVCRRISQMDYLLNELKRACPNAKVAFVHGQMNERIIENTMIDFCNGDYDVLLSTTIIESGLDIPNCNTLVVYEADKYGLSQLYQLKGRIGRGDVKAVCYLTYLKGDFVSDVARKRLDAINQNTEFGAGFKIAMKDLEIRGAGNLLGPEQSGHMASVGYDMYCKLMKKAVSQAKGEMAIEPSECSVELSVDAYIPPSYIDDDVVKVEAYKMISAVKNTVHAKEIQDELKDRFGPLPLSVKNLITTSLIKSFGEMAGLSVISKTENSFRLKYADETRVDFNKLMGIMEEYKRDVKLMATEPPTIIFMPKRMAVQELFTFLNRITRCIM